MDDLIIRNGTVIDGTGAERRLADVAIRDGIIVGVGKKLGVARRIIEADGKIVTPGWVDIHTHYDGQATWDPYLTPSSWHGVTTAVFGNCSVGFAPVRRGSERYLINLMEGVEDIPETVLAEGVNFCWESFPEYLDALEGMPRIMDVGAQVPHAPLRFYVMGERGADHLEKPTHTEIEIMGRYLEESLCAGALGFTTSRTTKHRAADGRLTPGLSASEQELLGLALAMRRAGSGVLEVNSDFGAGDFEILKNAAEVANRPLSILLIQVDNAPNLWRETLDQVGKARSEGLAVNAQVGCRAVGILMSLEGSIHPFVSHPLWKDIQHLSPAERVTMLTTEPELRRRLILERPDDEHIRWMERVLERAFEITEPVDYEPSQDAAIGFRAKRDRRDPFELALDIMLGSGGKGLILHPFENYNSGDLRVVEEMLLDDNTVMGGGDAGAHVGILCDASSPTTLLTHWARDRKRGRKLPLEFLVRKQSRDTARAYGLCDRGVIDVGFKADINVIDFDSLTLSTPTLAYDLPAGGKRFIQRASGYCHTLVSGVEVTCQDDATGQLPGRLIRGAQASPLAG